MLLFFHLQAPELHSNRPGPQRTYSPPATNPNVSARRDYFSAAWPEPWQILGIALHPFSLGHYIKLKQFGNVFVSEKSEVPTIGDLLLGVCVCSMKSHPDPAEDEFWQWWNRPAESTVLSRFFRKQPLRPAERDLIAWGRSARQFDFDEKAKQFAAYITQHSETPRYWIFEEKQDGGKSGAHWVHAVIHGLVAECGYSQLEAYNVPVAKALQDYIKACEAQGGVRLMTDEEIAFTEGKQDGA